MRVVGNGGARRAALAVVVGLSASAAITLGSMSVASARGLENDPPTPTPTQGSATSTTLSQAEQNLRLRCEPLKPAESDEVPVIIVAGSRSDDQDRARQFEQLAKPPVRVIDRYALGDEVPKGYEELGQLDSDVAGALAKDQGPHVVLVLAEPAEVTQVSRPLNEAYAAFIKDGNEVASESASEWSAAAVERYDERIAGLNQSQETDSNGDPHLRLKVPSEAVTLTATVEDGAVVVDSPQRAPRATLSVSNLTLGGEPLCEGSATALPFEIVAPASDVDLEAQAGKTLRLDAGQLGSGITASISGKAEAGPTPEATPTSAPTNDAGGQSDEDDTDPPNDGGSSLGLVVGAVVVLAVAGLAAYLLLGRKPKGPASAAWAGGPGGPVPPASPHGPSPTSSAGGASDPFAGAAPMAAAAAAVAAPTGRAVTPPAFVPLDFGDPAPGWTAAVPGDGAVRISDLGLMRVQPMETEHGRTWSTQSSVAVGAAGWLEKKAGKGEDAEPTVRLHEARRGIVGVYDGTGGAGSAPARRLRDGTEQTGAFVASRLARDLVESWYAGVVERGAVASDADGLRDFLMAGFRDEAEFTLESSVGLKGSLSRVLPTTMALAAFGTLERDGRQTTLIDALWAGDSRTYLLTPRDGLQVLSVDDTRETDALALIRNDQPMDNLVSADRPFRVNHRQVAIDSPAVILTATDGCFGYVKTPAQFEHLLLTSLRQSTTLEGWAGAVIEALATFTADDASFALSAVGFSSFAALQSAFAERGAYVAEHHWAPFDGVTDDAVVEQLREQSWAEYRDRYHARLADSPEP